jgi:hypothetical protein
MSKTLFSILKALLRVEQGHDVVSDPVFVER